jgi:predicted acylesterase/phospholipase RssA
MDYAPAYNANFGELGFEVSQRWPERERIAAKGKTRDTLGLALSGGGYRSAIFNFGVLKGLHALGLLPRVDYLSVVSGGSWIGTPFAMAESLDFFFHESEDTPSFIEEAFESLLPNPVRVAQEMALARKTRNYLSNIFGRLLARTFLREHGDHGRTKPLADPTLIRDGDRPFLIVNGTAFFRRPGTFDVTQECFEMTQLYCGSRSLGYLPAAEVKDDERAIRIRDAVAISGAAVAAHVPGLGEGVAGIGLSRELENFAAGRADAPADLDTDEIDVADGGFYNNLGVESLVNRGCGYLIVVDAEHDPESKTAARSNQRYTGLRTLQGRTHIPLPDMPIATLDRADEALHVFDGGAGRPDVLYVKLKSLSAFDRAARRRSYNKPGFLENLFGRGTFRFDPQFSTAKLDYSFAEHRNLSELGEFAVTDNAQAIRAFVRRAR